jgi:hypothetical protein
MATCGEPVPLLEEEEYSASIGKVIVNGAIRERRECFEYE